MFFNNVVLSDYDIISLSETRQIAHLHQLTNSLPNTQCFVGTEIMKYFLLNSLWGGNIRRFYLEFKCECLNSNNTP